MKNLNWEKMFLLRQVLLVSKRISQWWKCAFKSWKIIWLKGRWKSWVDASTRFNFWVKLWTHWEKTPEKKPLNVFAIIKLPKCAHKNSSGTGVVLMKRTKRKWLPVMSSTSNGSINYGMPGNNLSTFRKQRKISEIIKSMPNWNKKSSPLGLTSESCLNTGLWW